MLVTIAQKSNSGVSMQRKFVSRNIIALAWVFAAGLPEIAEAGPLDDAKAGIFAWG